MTDRNRESDRATIPDCAMCSDIGHVWGNPRPYSGLLLEVPWGVAKMPDQIIETCAACDWTRLVPKETT